MKLSIAVRLLALALTPLGVGFSQGNSQAALGRGASVVKAARSADEAWAMVTGFVPSRTDPTRRLDPSDPDALSPSELYRQASLAANAFHTSYLNDARGGHGKKLEVIYALQAVQLGAANFKSQAAALALAYRADKKNTDADRFDVAFLADGSALADTLKGKRFIDDGVKYEQLADSLYAEFGDTTEMHNLYVSIVRTTDPTTATRVANRLLTFKKAPAWVKDSAQAVLDRSKLIGKPLDLKITTIGGDIIDLSARSAKPTVIYLWNVADGLTASLEMLNHFNPMAVADARWLYVGLGGEQPVSDRPMAGSPFASTHCFVKPQFGNPITNYLKVNQAPYAFVLNRAGKVVGYGFPENIAALLQAARN